MNMDKPSAKLSQFRKKLGEPPRGSTRGGCVAQRVRVAMLSFNEIYQQLRLPIHKWGIAFANHGELSWFDYYICTHGLVIGLLEYLVQRHAIVEHLDTVVKQGAGEWLVSGEAPDDVVQKIWSWEYDQS